MIKIVHTADLHFGLTVNRYPTIAERLKDEGLKELKALVQHGNNEGAMALSLQVICSTAEPFL